MNNRSLNDTPIDVRTGYNSLSQPIHLKAQKLKTRIVCEMLEDADRRAIITYFTESKVDVAPFPELVDFCLREVVRDERLPTREGVATQLRQSHLPVLEAIGIIEYKSQQEIVCYHGDPHVEEILRCTQEE